MNRRVRLTARLGDMLTDGLCRLPTCTNAILCKNYKPAKLAISNQNVAAASVLGHELNGLGLCAHSPSFSMRMNETSVARNKFVQQVEAPRLIELAVNHKMSPVAFHGLDGWKVPMNQLMDPARIQCCLTRFVRRIRP
jgi:hypothetical protein